MRFATLIIVGCFCSIGPVAAQPAMMGNMAPQPPVTGVVQSFDGKVLTFKQDDGVVIKAPFVANSAVIVSEKSTLSDIKTGDFVASGGTKGPDGSISANEIRIFSEPRNEGQYPMAQPGQTMTNAVVKRVETSATVQGVGNAGGKQVVKLTFHGSMTASGVCTGRAPAAGSADKPCMGETEFSVPANIPIVRWTFSTPAAITAGTHASVAFVKAPTGAVSVQRVVLQKS